MKELEFYIDPKLKRKFELMIERVQSDDEQDNAVIFEGDTGIGKTNAGCVLAYLVARETGRPFSVDNIFFDTDKAVEFASTTRNQIIMFDEPAFGGLKAEWRTRTQINLVKLLLTSRMKRHFLIFNLAKFNKFSDDILEKAIALIKIYKQDESKKQRRFLYIPKKRIPDLLLDWHKKHKKTYWKRSIYHGTLFRYLMPEIIDMKEYNRKKEEAISKIGDPKHHLSKGDVKMLKMQYSLYRFVIDKHADRYKLAEYLGINEGTLSKWGNIERNHRDSMDYNEICHLPPANSNKKGI